MWPVRKSLSLATLVCILLTSVQQVATEESCTYTFEVPRPPGSQCGDDIHEDLDELKALVDSLIIMVERLEKGHGRLGFDFF